MNKHRQAYLDMQEKHRKELSDFPIAYAFDNKQLEEALEKLGATRDEVVTVFEHGDIVKKENAPKLIAMLKRHTEEMKEAMQDEEFAEAAFSYEMDNHEFAINWDGDADVLNCFGMDYEYLEEHGLDNAYRRARNAHMKRAMEWGMI